MAAEYNNGVVIGADSRTATGAYVANRVTDKITRVTDHIYVCRSGSAPDTQAIADIVAYHLDFFRAEHQDEPCVRTAVQLFRELGYKNRNTFQAGMIVLGWDRHDGPQVYSVPLGGMYTRQNVCIGGSGSSYMYGFVDANYRKDMTRQECVQFVQDAVNLAINRDLSSGGVVRLGVLEAGKPLEKLITTPEHLKQFDNE